MGRGVADHTVGLIPAAGQASRLGRLPCSKEVFPLPGGAEEEGGVRVMADCLLDAYEAADIGQVFFIIRDGKWDIPAYFGDGSGYGLSIGYLMMGLPWGTPFTLDQAFEFIQGKTVAMGFPDMQFRPRNVFTLMLQHLANHDADVVLGLMPQENRAKWDMVGFDSEKRVVCIDIKQPDTKLDYCWFAAVWSPRFTCFMHDFLASLAAGSDLQALSEIYVGNVVQAAMKVGMDIRCEVFHEGEVVDLGTPDDLAGWVQRV